MFLCYIWNVVDDKKIKGHASKLQTCNHGSEKLGQGTPQHHCHDQDKSGGLLH